MAILKMQPDLDRMLHDENLDKIYSDIEAPLVEVLADMELTGVCIDVDALNDAASDIGGRLAALESEIVASRRDSLRPPAAR